MVLLVCPHRPVAVQLVEPNSTAAGLPLASTWTTNLLWPIWLLPSMRSISGPAVSARRWRDAALPSLTPLALCSSLAFGFDSTRCRRLPMCSSAPISWSSPS